MEPALGSWTETGDRAFSRSDRDRSEVRDSLFRPSGCLFDPRISELSRASGFIPRGKAIRLKSARARHFACRSACIIGFREAVLRLGLGWGRGGISARNRARSEPVGGVSMVQHLPIGRRAT